MNPNMKIKEITASLSGVISNGPYENLRPGFSMTVEPINGESPEKIFNNCMEYLHTLMALEDNRAKTELTEKQYTNIRFREKDGIKYPSVTSILFWNAEWQVSPDHLQQLASRGIVVESLIFEYIKTGEWKDPTTMLWIAEDVAILKSGSSHLSWDDCSHQAFMKEYGDKLKNVSFHGEVFNDEYLYSGEYDIVGEFDGKKSLIDIKCGGYDFRQLAAYARCLEGIEQLVIFAVGPTDNKCGYKKPIICTTIQSEFEEFLKARAKFRKQFGV
jgi:hypothetical protein